ncbi:MAG: shikimate kinase, partial [Rhodobacterales bacterium]|nr:shikimate kinase [Rhodobacterales bacterium]
MEYNLSKTIVLIGLMGAGKTAIGTILAEHLGVDFVDSDEEISRAANMSIPEIFDRDGEDFFRLKETQIIGRLLGSRPHILSTGGGAFLTNENRKMISGNAVSVWLDAELETLWDRVKEKKSRPLLMVKDPKTALKNLYISRKPQYAK